MLPAPTCPLAHRQCKHQLAARLAAALGRCQEVAVSDLRMAQMLMQSELQHLQDGQQGQGRALH